MNFCRGEDEFSETKCCLFNQLYGSRQKCSRRTGQCGLSPSKSSRKGSDSDDNEQKHIKKGNRLKKSQQIVKLSLSKTSIRSKSNSHQIIQQKSSSINKSTSLPSSPKSKLAQDSIRSIISKPTFFNYPISKNNANHQAINKLSLVHGQMASCNANHCSKVVSKLKICPFRHPMKVMSVRPLPPLKTNQWQQTSLGKRNDSSQHFSMPVNPSKTRLCVSKCSKPQDQLRVSNFSLNAQQSINIRHPISTRNAQTKQIIGQTSSFLEPMLVQTQCSSLTNPQKKQQKLKTLEYIYITPQQFSKSRLVDSLNNKFKGKHLQTQQSIYGSRTSEIKQIKQSIIVINFFNPNQKIQKQIQKQLNSRNCQEIYS